MKTTTTGSTNSRLTTKQKIVLAIGGLFIAWLFRLSYVQISDQYTGIILVLNTIIGVLNRLIFTIGGLASIIVLSVLFYRFRTPKDTGTKEDGFELLSHATRLERKGQIEEALKAYLYISEKYSEHEVGKDAKISYDVLQKKKNGG